jgi:hypothetical protein
MVFPKLQQSEAAGVSSSSFQEQKPVVTKIQQNPFSSFPKEPYLDFSEFVTHSTSSASKLQGRRSVVRVRARENGARSLGGTPRGLAFGRQGEGRAERVWARLYIFFS